MRQFAPYSLCPAGLARHCILYASEPCPNMAMYIFTPPPSSGKTGAGGSPACLIPRRPLGEAPGFYRKKRVNSVFRKRLSIVKMP